MDRYQTPRASAHAHSESDDAPVEKPSAIFADPRSLSEFTPSQPHAIPAFSRGGIRPAGLHSVVLEETPASAAKLTMEGLEHWRVRLGRELAQLSEDIESTAVLADRWSGKCGASVDELKELYRCKERDLEAVERAIEGIQGGISTASVAARRPVVAASPNVFLLPRATDVSAAERPIAVLASSPVAQSKAGDGRRSTTTRGMARNVARKSAILANSPDVSKKLVF